MKNHRVGVSKDKAAKIAGFMFIFTFIIPTLNWALVLSKYNVAGDGLATAKNILAKTFLFRFGNTVELFLSIGLIKGIQTRI